MFRQKLAERNVSHLLEKIRIHVSEYEPVGFLQLEHVNEIYLLFFCLQMSLMALSWRQAL
jgi:hypothetical protein